MNATPATPAAPTVTARSETRGWRWLLPIGLAAIVGGAGGAVGEIVMTQRMLRQARTFGRSDASRSETAYRWYLQRCPGDSVARKELAALLQYRQPEAALKELRKIPIDDPSYPDVVRQAAAIALNLGRDYDALEPLRFLESHFPHDAGVQLALAELRFRGRDFESALEHSRRCRALKPEEVQAMLVEAEALDELKRSAEMVEPLEAALQLDAELPQAHLNLAYAYQFVGRGDEALGQVQWFLRRFPQSAAAHRTLALVQRSRGRMEEALSAVRRSLELHPNQFEAILLEAELLLFLRRSDEAYGRLERLQQAHGSERRLLTLLARAAALSGRKSEAAKWQERLAKVTANDF